MPSKNLVGSFSIDLFLLAIQLAWEGELATRNKLGFAFWARIETTQPSTTYWFGPFSLRSGLKNSLGEFLSDLDNEEPGSVTYQIVRCRPDEPLTSEF